VPGTHPVEEVLQKVLTKFDLKPNGQERKRCHLLSDSFICEIANAQDFESTNTKLSRLRTELDEQFNYTFSLRPRNAPIKIKGQFNTDLAREIIEA
jgi:hypothetical protein